MRLLNARTLQFAEFFESDVPPYVILSHRWVGSETTLSDFQINKDASDESISPGIAKVKRICQLALERGHYEWVWVDTCCIDKTSSVELTEAINSMWNWYHNAEVCYVYMSDVSIGLKSPDQIKKEVADSRWFTRGWTLQELLAPRKEEFFDASWTLLGKREEKLMASAITSATGIESEYFGDLEVSP
jgi:hypothetical protein